ncbi:hypothetical protein Tco_1023464 [Tanacetum coccineum]
METEFVIPHMWAGTEVIISFTSSSTRSNPLVACLPSPILPIITEKVQQEKLKAVKARLNFEEASQHFESGTPIRRRNLKERLGPRRVRSRSGSPKPRRGRSESPRKKEPEKKMVFKRLEKGVFHRLGVKGKVYTCTRTIQGVCHTTTAAETLKAVTRVLVQEQRNLLPRNMATKGYLREERRNCQKVKEAREVIGSQNRKDKSQSLKTTYLSLRVWFDDIPQESIDSYDDLKKAFLENYL